MTPEDTILVVIDMQEKFVPAIPDFQTAADRIAVLTAAADVMGIPVLVTEQYPKGLGPTVPQIAEKLPQGTPRIEKSSFSCFGSEEFSAAVRNSGRKNIIFTGIEAHICVMQTAVEAKELGYASWLACDAAASRKTTDFQPALEFMHSNGVGILSTESLLFMLLKTSKSPFFKSVQKLIK